MSDEELEHLRAILSRNQPKPKKTRFFGVVGRALKGLFTRPKKPVGRKEGGKRRKDEAA
jgi:hypothetical protein